MTTTDLKTVGFDVAWTSAAIARAERGGEPAWGVDARREAATIARTLSFPSRTDELWRRTDFRTLEGALEGLDPFAAPAGKTAVPAPVLARMREEGLSDTADTPLVQVDGAVALDPVSEKLARQGVVVASLDRALREHGDLLKGRLGALIRPDEDWYTAVGAALHGGGTFVLVPDGVEAALPIRMFHTLAHAGRMASPRTVVVLGKGARATIIEEQLSSTVEGIAFYNAGTEIFVGEEAHLTFATLQDWGRNVYHYSNQRARIERGGELQCIHTLLGSRMAKMNSYFDLAGSGASAYVHGFVFGDARQHFHLHTLQRHLRDHTTSDLLIKTCLKDRARSVYQGLIQVSEGAQRTDAYQANRNLLLSDQARADSIPGLEILANDVRCTHGATIGHVDDEQMYYLRSRGLPAMEAQRLIVEGFFVPVLDRIPLEGVREGLRHAIQRKIG
jgi:Fe-S cluster assembly protein SufD